jgi:hypothetical protein
VEPGERPADKRPKWALSPEDFLKIRSFEIIASATAVLGYCSEVVIQLGTEQRCEQYRLQSPSIYGIGGSILELGGLLPVGGMHPVYRGNEWRASLVAPKCPRVSPFLKVDLD